MIIDYWLLFFIVSFVLLTVQNPNTLHLLSLRYFCLKINVTIQ